MSLTTRQIEWHFIDEGEQEALQWRSSNNDDVYKPTQEALEGPHKPKQPNHLYELLLGIAILYGVALFFIWQQAMKRTSLLENEVVSLRNDLSQYQNETAEHDTNQAAILLTDSGSSFSRGFETELLRFEVSRRAAESAEAVAQRSNAKYKQLHQDFGLPLPSSVDKLTIIIDLAVSDNYPLTDERILVAPHPEFSAERYGVSEEDALTNEIFIRLSEYVFETALASKTIKPQWRAITFALKTHLRLENGHRPDWQMDSIFLSHRHLAQSRSIDLVHQTVSELDGQPRVGVQASLAAYETANPLIEYILEIYGYAEIPTLLDALEKHDTWGTLAPDIFNISASEFEKNWHSYLEQQYPKDN